MKIKDLAKTKYLNEIKFFDSFKIFVVLKGGDYIGKILFKYSDCSMGNLCRAQFIGYYNDNGKQRFALQEGRSKGGGYDMETAAVLGFRIGDYTIKDDCNTFDGELRAAGFVVIRI